MAVENITPIDTARITALVRAVADGIRASEIDPKPLPLMYSFEMKQAAKGQRYYDIKVMNIQPGNFEEALKLYDELDAELSKRALLGE